MRYQLGETWFEAESKYLTLSLRDSTDDLERPEVLRARLADDGYLFLRGLHDRQEVLEARRDILERLAAEGRVDPNAPLLEGVVHPQTDRHDTTTVRGREHLKTPALRRLLFGPRVERFFTGLFGEKPLGYDFEWLRTAGPGASSTIHYDVVYMGRGSKRLCTLWTPLGRITPEMGPLVLCLGSNRWQNVIETYGASDVDRDLIRGHFSTDPAELVDRFGGRWATATFEPGDVVIVGMFLMHASLTNNSNRFRISCDTRFQPASEPGDERWVGEHPPMHARFWDAANELEPLEVSRARWGV